MFQVTRLAAGITKTTRKALKNVTTGKINLGNASDSFNNFYNNNVKDLKYSKNIFKRMYLWTKDFISNYKNISANIKESIQSGKEKLGNQFTKKDKKEIKNLFINTIKTGLKQIKTELKDLIKAAKAEKK